MIIKVSPGSSDQDAQERPEEIGGSDEFPECLWLLSRFA